MQICITKNGNTVFEAAVPFAKSFGFVPKGAPVLYCGSSLFLCLDCNQASFMQTYGVGFGMEWKATLTLL